MSLPADIESIVSPLSGRSKTCGYCSPQGQRSENETSYDSASLRAYFLSCSAYQAMIDRGWRRSGTYCYKPDLRVSCCPQYTIRLDAPQYKPSRSQRKLLNRWNRYILNGDSELNSMEVDQMSKSKTSKAPGGSTKGPPFTTLSAAVHESETGFCTQEEPAHTFTVILEPSSFTNEKFELFKKYQADIHHDLEKSSSGFKRFLVETPLNVEPIPYSSTPADHLPKNYGSYHQLYRVDGQLIAIGVIDILPNCVSSVYFMYSKKWEKYSMGKISALREISLVQEMREAGAPEMEYYYMGFYIYSCQKMRYKGEYAPSYLADPETYAWYPLESCIPALETHRYACFSNPSHSSANDEDLEELAVTSQLPVLSADSPEFDDLKTLAKTRNSGQIHSVLIKDTGYLSFKEVREDLGSCARGLSHDLASKVVFNI
ncbi:hypothetical protein HYPSUDRAFT_174975 [Hypholoma sublateritium FD-334 SS-4]|uniref:Arginyl-tRNA--protein transferase 1 n=1 Tax=Hypholoma sublateritium (strain FD-334 SS-4) TaxID=945553 RepID=A0A0D2QEC8_HYPSF|nr:hypothetical protein HYPSUDRAFT_174975 [Hypholoma sublateritium FD-334 SS-4]